MKRLVTLINLILFICVQCAFAQVDNLRMSDLRDINFQVVKLIGDYETYSAFTGTEDYSGFKNLFESVDALVYCDQLYDSRLDDKVALNEYLEIVKSNNGDIGTNVKINKINLPSFTGKTGIIGVEILKSVNGLNICGTSYNDIFNLVVTIRFQFKGGLFENFKISEISSREPRGKLIVFRAFDPKGKAMANESFLINNRAFTTDMNGNIRYHVMNQDSSLLITTPINSVYDETLRYKNYEDLLANRKKGTSPCEPNLVEFTVKKAEVLATTTKPINKETKKEKLERESYEKAITGAQTLLAEKKYVEAKVSYQSALKIRPDDKACQQKIKEIDELLSDITALNKSYAKEVSEGDVNYNAKKYSEAIDHYQLANSIKPEEKYPLQQLEKINGILADFNRKDENYSLLIAKADKQLTEKKYDDAISTYTKALTIKPNEKYPQEKINAIKSIQGIADVNKLYAQAISDGNASFAVKDFEKAIINYKAALQLKPDEQLPKDKIAQTEFQIRKLNDNYAAFIAEGDKKYSAKQYSDALAAYHEALEIKPSEQYPKDQIAEINAVMETKKASEFPVGVVMNYILPSATGPVFNKTELIQNKLTPALSLGYGVIAAYKFKLGGLGKFQVRTGMTMDNINFNSELVQYTSQFDTFDPDDYPYTREIQVKDLTEEIKLSYFTIPIDLEKIFSLGKSGWAFSLNAGVNLMLLSSASYGSSAEVSYTGYYPAELFNLTIKENGVYDFGNYAVSTSNSIKAESSLISMDFGAGLSKKIWRMSVFAEFRHRISNTNMFELKDLWSLSQDFQQMESTMNFKNKYNLSYNFLSVGLVFNL